jgi:hypothetical protein
MESDAGSSFLRASPFVEDVPNAMCDRASFARWRTFHQGESDFEPIAAMRADASRPSSESGASLAIWR